MTYSVKQFYERMGAGANNFTLRADQPMDAGYTWNLCDNIAHLADEAPKYRINFMHNYSADGMFGLPGPIRVFNFLTQIYEPNRYPNYDVRVAFGNGNSEVPVRVSLTTPNSALKVRDSGWPNVLASWTGTSPYPGIAWTIDETTGSPPVSRCPFIYAPPAYFPELAANVGHFVWLRLIVEYNYVSGEGGPNTMIMGVQVREYMT